MEAGPGRIRPEVTGTEVRLMVDAVAEGAVSGPVAEVRVRGIVGVENGDRRLLDQARLGGTVRLHRAVELEVLARHGRDHADVEPAVPRPPQRQGMGGGLHDDAVVPGRDHARQELLKLERLRRRAAVFVRRDRVADPYLYGSDLS